MSLSCLSNTRAGFSMQEVGAAISSVLASGSLVAEQACFLPLSPDQYPVIGPVPGTHGAYVASGEALHAMMKTAAVRGGGSNEPPLLAQMFTELLLVCMTEDLRLARMTGLSKQHNYWTLSICLLHAGFTVCGYKPHIFLQGIAAGVS